jgi:hypothetical protein
VGGEREARYGATKVDEWWVVYKGKMVFSYVAKNESALIETRKTLYREASRRRRSDTALQRGG